MVAAVLGWTGTAGTMLAYAMIARGRLTADSRRYASLNLVGGLMAACAAALYGAWPSAASNLVWAVVGGCSLVAVTRARRLAGRAERRTGELPRVDELAGQPA